MRTTVSIDDTLAKELQRRAAESGRSFKDVLNETLVRGLAVEGGRKRYRLRTASLGGAVEGVDLTKALSLAAALEDEESARKLARRR
jgi:plasmid stability protein